MTKKVEFINVDTGDKVYVDLPIATNEARAYYSSEYIISILSELKFTGKITTQQFRSVRGKVRKNPYSIIEVMRFINKFTDDKIIENLFNKIKDLYNKEFVKLSHNNYMEIAKPKVEENNGW